MGFIATLDNQKVRKCAQNLQQVNLATLDKIKETDLQLGILA
jgi:hypothetical protein